MLYNEFTKENLDLYLKELAKEFRKLNGKLMPAEIILIGGASVLANYGFRDLTKDIDAIIAASSAMKEAINKVGDKYSLPTGWLNTDFQRTKSYSPKLYEVSVYYKTFSNILTVRCVAAEYLIAMKLMSGRQYKNDLSDVIGILREHRDNGCPISYESIDKAVNKLYGGWSTAPKESIKFINLVYENKDYDTLFKQYRESEKESFNFLVGFEKKYPNVVTNDNINSILDEANKKKKNIDHEGR